ncbi:hypothetical protein D3C74_452340 [compost metagenome]
MFKRAVYIEYAKQPALFQEGNDDFAVRCGIAGNVSGKGMDIVYDKRTAFLSRCSADPAAQRNANACGQSLKSSEDKLLAVK